MFSVHPPLPVYEPMLLCPSCQTAALCRTGREVCRNSVVTVLVCPSCGVYHSMENSETGRTLYASPVGS